MEISLRISHPLPGVVEMCIGGELDSASAYVVRSRVVDMVRHEPSLVVIDFSGLTFIDSAGLEALEAAVASVSPAAEALVVCASEVVVRLLEILGSDLLPVAVECEPL